MRRYIVALVGIAIMWTFPGAALSQTQSKDQLKCSKILDIIAHKITIAQARHARSCTKNGSRGKLGVPPTVDACLVADPFSKVFKSTIVGVKNELKRCIGPGGFPDFGAPTLGGAYTPPTVAEAFDPLVDEIFTEHIRNVSVIAELAQVGDLFGLDPDNTIALKDTQNAAARCQDIALKSAQLCEKGQRTLYRKCKKKALAKGGAASSGDLIATCYLAGDDFTGIAKDKARIDKLCGQKMSKLMSKRCAGLTLSELFPGACGAATNVADFTDCMVGRVTCRYCQQLNATDSLGKDCDLFDDAIDNDSCADVVGSCGDGLLDSGLEQCDDGNNDDGDCCTSTCTFEAQGSTCGSATDDECTNPDTCDDSGNCQDNHEPSGLACSDDGNECTDDECDGSGLCGHPNTSAGTRLRRRSR